MSKTFKNATNEGTEVYVGEGINTDSVQLIIRSVGSDIGKAGIYLNSSDIPALALAILEVAGVEPVDHTVTGLGKPNWLEGIAHGLKLHIEHEAKRAAEDQAKLEAEALKLLNASRIALHSAPVDELMAGHKLKWLAVARKAREMSAEK